MISQPIIKHVLAPTCALLAALAGLSACSNAHRHHTVEVTTRQTTSSSATVTTSTALPPPAPPANGQAIAAFLTHAGDPLLKFEAATAQLASGSVPTSKTCGDVRSALSKIATNPGTLAGLAAQIPDPLLAAEFGRDISAKIVVLGGCSGSTQQAARASRQAAAAVDTRLGQVGISVK
jgi:hypothetical protein